MSASRAQTGARIGTSAVIVIICAAVVIIALVTQPFVQRLADLVAEKERKRAEKEAEAQGAKDRARAASEVAERAGFLYCDKTSARCDPSTQTAIKVYAGVSEFETRDGVPCQRGGNLCVEPSSPAFTAKPGTRIVKITDESTSIYSSIRITEGTHAGKVGVVESSFFHDGPPR